MTAPRSTYGPRVPTGHELALALIVVLVVTWWAVLAVIESDNQVDTRRPDPTVTVATAPGMAPVLYQEDTDG